MPGTSGGQGIVNALTGAYTIRQNGQSDMRNSLSFDWPKNNVRIEIYRPNCIDSLYTVLMERSLDTTTPYSKSDTDLAHSQVDKYLHNNPLKIPHNMTIHT